MDLICSILYEKCLLVNGLVLWYYGCFINRSCATRLLRGANTLRVISQSGSFGSGGGVLKWYC